MNKYGFISSILTFILLLCQFIPLGIYFGPGGEISTWLLIFLGIGQNPYFNFYESFPVDLFQYKNQHVYLWGILTEGRFQLWYSIDFVTFFAVFVLSLLAGILAMIGCAKDNKTGKSLIDANFYLLLCVISYIILGIPIYSQKLIGTELGLIGIFYYLSFGFYLLLIDFILAMIAKLNHPIE